MHVHMCTSVYAHIMRRSFLFRSCLGNKVASQAEAAGTHGLPTEARTPVSLFLSPAYKTSGQRTQGVGLSQNATW